MSRVIFENQGAADREVREFAARLCKLGAEFEAHDSRGHLIYRWPNGTRTVLPSSPSPRSAWRKRAARAAIEGFGRDTAIPSWLRDAAHLTRRRPRHATRVAGFDLSAAARARARREAQERIEQARSICIADYDEAIRHANRTIRAAENTLQLQRACAYRDRLIGERRALVLTSVA